MPKDISPELGLLARFLRPQFFDAIGRVVVYWAYIEWEVANMLVNALGLSREQGSALVGRLRRFPYIVNTLRNTVNIAYPDLAERFKELYDELDELVVERNHVVHDQYFAITDPEPMSDRVLRQPWVDYNGVLKKPKPMKSHEISATARRMDQMYTKLINFSNSVGWSRRTLRIVERPDMSDWPQT